MTGSVGLWHLNGTADDTSGEGNDGTITGATPSVGIPLLSGSTQYTGSYSFGPGSDYINFGAASNFLSAASSFSIVLWMKGDVGYTPAQFHSIIGATNALAWTTGFGLFWQDSTTLRYFLGAYTGTTVDITVASLSDWNHIALTYDGSTMEAYINGALAGSAVHGTTLTGLTNDFQLARLGTDTYIFEGDFDEVAIWDRDLSLAEIASIYNNQPVTSVGSSFGGDPQFTWNKISNTLTVTGDISASVNISGSSFYGDGSNLTDLNASNISAGTLNNARLPATISVTNVTASALVSSSFFYGDGSNLTNLPSAAITTYNSASAGRVITSVNATTVEGEPNLTFDNTTLVITGDVSGSGNVSGSAFYGDGSNLTGLARDFGPSATDPVGSPNAGDFYYNTVLNMTMHYDSSRTKWLSAETAELKFGRNGNTGTGAYYRGINGRSYSAIQGRYAEHNGTIVSFSYTRGDTDAAVFNVTSGGTTVSFLSSSAIGGSTETLNDDFAEDTVLGVRNQSADGNTTNDVLGVARMKWRI